MADQHLQPMQEPLLVEQAIAQIVNHQPFEQLVGVSGIAATEQLPLVQQDRHQLHLVHQPGPDIAQLPPDQSPIQHQPEDSELSPAKKRRRYNNNFKAGVLEHLKDSGAKLPAIAKQYGIPENTLREWTKVRHAVDLVCRQTRRGRAQ
jgi:hypothetical protein